MKIIFTTTQRIVPLSFFTFLLFLFFITAASAQEEIYQIQSPKLSIKGSGKLKDWNPLINNCIFDGKFIVKNNMLEEVADFKYSFSLDNSAAKTKKIFSIVNNAMLAVGSKEIMLSQENMMILPLMRIAYLTLDVKMPTGNHFSPLCLDFVIEDDQSISVKGTQTIWLYQFGVLPKNIKECHAEDKVTLDINFSLIKAPIVIAKNPPKERI